MSHNQTVEELIDSGRGFDHGAFGLGTLLAKVTFVVLAVTDFGDVYGGLVFMTSLTQHF